MKDSDSIAVSSSGGHSPEMAEDNKAKCPKRFAATVGTFDGVHLGHSIVLEALRKAASERGLEPLAITFADHPLSVIAPSRRPPAIMSSEMKFRTLRSRNVGIHILDFTPEEASLSAAQWLRNLHEHHQVDCIVIGYDNTFGHDGRSLSANDYIRLGEQTGVEVIVAPELEGVSSSAIRRLISEGRIEEANRMLDHPLTLDGTVAEGDHIGRRIGFPTANLALSSPRHRSLPPFGVYASEVTLPDGRLLPGVTNIGIRPSVSEIAPTPEPRIETYILGYDGPSLYGQKIEVGLISFMRPEKKFPGLDDLKAQLQKDIEARKALISNK